ncbi:hypothetical protein AVEN_130179-1 [Araneus ventricosus]|uniref:Uncharacterized protein n=1 Tax=Araneus ventricosus TaxID=182803 RepID=A0A4Y2M4K1_ARAVE|nr:hypothetical protein AVEN_130179-1 [Araneus ventricosus]
MDACSSRDRSDSENESVLTKDSTLCDVIENVPEEKTYSIEMVLCAFYRALTDRLVKKFSVEDFDVFISTYHLIRNYREITDGQLPTEIDFNDKATCLGYLHRYAACHTALVLEAVSSVFDSPSNELSLKIDSERLNVIFLGSGPGNDVLGFLIALYGNHEHIVDLDVTVVDKMSGWEVMFAETIELFKRIKKPKYIKDRNIFDDVNVSLSFMSADLTDFDEWSDELLDKLESADVVFFVKSLSHIPNSEKKNVLKNVIDCMEQESLLVYIDYPYPSRVFSSLSSSLRSVYRSPKEKYEFGYKYSKFGWDNNTFCHAEVRIFERC